MDRRRVPRADGRDVCPAFSRRTSSIAGPGWSGGFAWSWQGRRPRRYRARRAGVHSWCRGPWLAAKIYVGCSAGRFVLLMKLRLPVWVVFMIYLLVLPSVCLLGLVLLSVFQMFMCHRPIPMSPPALGGLCCAAALPKSEHSFSCARLGLCDSVRSVSKHVCVVQCD